MAIDVSETAIIGYLGNLATRTVAALDNKVDKVTGKGLSTADYSFAEKNKLAAIEETAQVNIVETIKLNNSTLPISDKTVNIDLSGYVTSETGKGLSSNDFTAAEKNKLAALDENADENVIESVKVDGTALTVTNKAVNIDLSGKVDKVTGKGLSSNDFTTTEKNKLSNIAANAQVNVIETIKVNGTALTVSNKAVNITVTGGSSDISVAETSSGVQIKDGSTVLYTIPIMKE